MAPSKPLAEVLREAKEAKEEAFQAVWRQMKTGALRACVWRRPRRVSFCMDACGGRQRAAGLPAQHNAVHVLGQQVQPAGCSTQC